MPQHSQNCPHITHRLFNQLVFEEGGHRQTNQHRHGQTDGPSSLSPCFIKLFSR